MFYYYVKYFLVPFWSNEHFHLEVIIKTTFVTTKRRFPLSNADLIITCEIYRCIARFVHSNWKICFNSMVDLCNKKIDESITYSFSISHGIYIYEIEVFMIEPSQSLSPIYPSHLLFHDSLFPLLFEFPQSMMRWCQTVIMLDSFYVCTLSDTKCLVNISSNRIPTYQLDNRKLLHSVSLKMWSNLRAISANCIEALRRKSWQPVDFPCFVRTEFCFLVVKVFTGERLFVENGDQIKYDKIE